VAGFTLSVVDVTSFAGAVPATCLQSYAWPYSAGVIIADHPGQCAQEQSGKEPAGTTFLQLGIDSQSPIATGTYTLYRAPQGTSDVSASFVTFNAAVNPDGSCTGGSTWPALSGTITLTSVSGNSLAGSYSLTFENSATSVTGTFSSTGCALTSAELCTIVSRGPNCG